MANIKVQRTIQENEALKKAVKQLEDEFSALRDVFFALIRQLGRVRISAENAGALRKDDQIQIKRDGDDWLVSYEAGEGEVKPAVKTQLLAPDGKPLS